MRLTLRRLLLLVLVLLVSRFPVYAFSSTWIGASADFSDPANWSSSIPPSVTNGAEFTASGSQAVNISQMSTSDDLLFDAGAPAYTITVSTDFANGGRFGFGGITNNSSQQQHIDFIGHGASSLSGGISGSLLVTDSTDGSLFLGGSSFTGPLHVVNSGSGTISMGPSGILVFGLDAGNSTFENSGGGTYKLLSGFRGGGSTLLNTNGSVDVMAVSGFTNATDLSNMTIVNAGTFDMSASAAALTVGTLSGTGSVVLGANGLTLEGTNADAELSGVISGMGGSLTKIGTGTLTLLGANTYTGGTTVTAGILKGNTTSLQGDIVDHASLIFDQDVDGTYAGVLSGASAITKQGLGNITFSGASFYAGTVDITQGGVTVTGALPGNFSVEQNTTLSGTGLVSAVNNHGTVHPGLSTPGSMTVASYGGDGTVDILFDGTSNSKLNVTGAAVLTGSHLQLSGSQFSVGAHPVVTAGTPLTGGFASVSAPLFLHYTMANVGNNLQVNVQSYGFQSAAQSTNQHAVAGALDVLESHPASATPLVPLSTLATMSAAQSAFDQMSGDALTSFYDVGLRQAHLFTQGILERTVPMDSAVGQTSEAPVQLAMAGDAAGLGVKTKSGSARRGLWARAIGDFAHTDSDSSTGSPESKANTGGFEAGVDKALTDDVTVGGFIGYTRTGVTVDDRNSTGDTNSFGIGAYGRLSPGQWFFDGSLAYIRNSNSMDRPIDFVGQTAHSDFTSPVVSLYGDAGYAFEPALDTALEPFLSLTISHLSQGSFTESGAPGEDLSVDDKSLNSVLPSIAVRATHLFKPESKHPFMLGGSLGLEYEMGTVERSIDARFADGSGPSFTALGTPQKRVAGDLSLSGRVALTERWQAFASYGLTTTSEHLAQALMGGARLQW